MPPPRSTLFPYTTLFRSVLVRGRGLPRVIVPGVRDIRGYQAMYRDFYQSILHGRQPEMSLERAVEDQQLRSEEHTSELQSPCNLVCRLLLEKKKKKSHSD